MDKKKAQAGIVPGEARLKETRAIYFDMTNSCPRPRRCPTDCLHAPYERAKVNRDLHHGIHPTLGQVIQHESTVFIDSIEMEEHQLVSKRLLSQIESDKAKLR